MVHGIIGGPKTIPCTIFQTNVFLIYLCSQMYFVIVKPQIRNGPNFWMFLQGDVRASSGDNFFLFLTLATVLIVKNLIDCEKLDCLQHEFIQIHSVLNDRSGHKGKRSRWRNGWEGWIFDGEWSFLRFFGCGKLYKWHGRQRRNQKWKEESFNQILILLMIVYF